MTSGASRTGQETSRYKICSPPVSGTSSPPVPQRSHELDLRATSHQNLTMNTQKKRSLAATQTSGPSLISQSSPPRQPASFGPRSSDSSKDNLTTMAHCTLSGPSTAAELRHLLSSVNRHHHTHASTTTYCLFASPSSSFLASQPPGPAWERDWPPPELDDEVHYC